MGEDSAQGPLILAIDLGSSSFRAAVGDASGRILSTARAVPKTHSPEEAGELALEYRPGEVWDLIIDLARRAIGEASVDAERINAVAVTAQRQGIALLDEALDVLYAGPNNDMRAVFPGAALDAEHGDLIWDACRHRPSYLLAWARLKWFQDEEPGLFGRARYVVTLGDWVALKLTGEAGVHVASGVEAGLVDVSSGEAATGISEAIGIGEIQIPRIVDSAEPVEALRADVAASLGLRAGIPVVNAGPDTQAGLVGMGIASGGATGVVAGWSCAVQRVTDAPVFDVDRVLWTGRHVVDGRYVLECNAGIMGGAYAWLAGVMEPGEVSSLAFERLDRAAANAAVGAGNLTAHLGPDSMNMSAPGLSAGGIVFPVPLALTPPSPGDVARATMEGFAFAIRASIEMIDGVAGSLSESVAVGGGMTRSSTFNSILAAVLDREISVGPADATLCGAAVIAGRAIGGDAPETGNRGAAVAPDPSLTSDYRDLFEHWVERSRILRELPV